LGTLVGQKVLRITAHGLKHMNTSNVYVTAVKMFFSITLALTSAYLTIHSATHAGLGWTVLGVVFTILCISYFWLILIVKLSALSRQLKGIWEKLQQSKASSMTGSVSMSQEPLDPPLALTYLRLLVIWWSVTLLATWFVLVSFLTFFMQRL